MPPSPRAHLFLRLLPSLHGEAATFSPVSAAETTEAQGIVAQRFSGLAPAFGPGHGPGIWDRVPHQAPGMEPASPSASVSASLYVSHEKILFIYS